jgi:hypothetical protein
VKERHFGSLLGGELEPGEDGFLSRFRAVCGDEHLLHEGQGRTHRPYGNPATDRWARTNGSAGPAGDHGIGKRKTREGVAMSRKFFEYGGIIASVMLIAGTGLLVLTLGGAPRRKEAVEPARQASTVTG